MKYNSLFESLDKNLGSKLKTRRYSLSDMISESYKSLYNCESGTNMQKLVESHLDDVRKHPSDIERLSRQLSILKEISRLTESGELKDEDLVPKKEYDEVEPKKERALDLTESKDDEDVEETDDENLIDESAHDEDVEETEDEDLLEDTELTDEEVEELTKHLEEIRKNKKVAECDAPKKKPVKESNLKGRKLKRSTECAKPVNESYSTLNLSEFSKKSNGKAFVKTLKKLDSKLKEGTALTRQESISLYKAANSAMTHLSVELEHNPKFLSTFKECTSLLAKDVNSVLGSLKEGKAPSKKTMKSLAKFSEALLRENYSIEELTMDAYAHFTDDLGRTPTVDDVLEYLLNNYDVAGISDSTPAEAGKAYDKVASILRQNNVEINEAEEEEDLPPIEDEENEFVGSDEGEISSEDEDDFDQEYADARVELHKDLVDEHGEDEDPGIQEKIAQDAEEVVNLPGITDEQVAEIVGDEETPEEETEEEPAEEETPEEEVEEKKDEKSEETVIDTGSDDITDDELAELKRHLTEMRKAKRK